MPRENLKGNTTKVPEVGKKKGGGEGAGERSVWESIVNGILLPPLLEMGMMIKGL